MNKSLVFKNQTLTSKQKVEGSIPGHGVYNLNFYYFNTRL